MKSHALDTEKKVAVTLGQSIFQLMQTSRVVADNMAEGVTDTFEVAIAYDGCEISLCRASGTALDFGPSRFFIIGGIAAHVTSLTFSLLAGPPRSQAWIALTKKLSSELDSSGLCRLPLVGSHAMPIEELELCLMKGLSGSLEKKIAVAAWATPESDKIVIYSRRLSDSWYMEVTACVDFKKELQLRTRGQYVREFFGCDPDDIMRLGGGISPDDYLSAFKSAASPR